MIHCLIGQPLLPQKSSNRNFGKPGLHKAHSVQKLCRLLCAAALLNFTFGCAVNAPYQLDEASKNHPATAVFIDYMGSASKANNFEEVLPLFNPARQSTISKLKGWHHFTYSASYNALSKGRCEQIKTKILSAARAQIDCIGPFVFTSFFLGDSQERMHLRTFMERVGEQWYVEKSGYAHTQGNGGGRELSRFGLKFKSDFETKPAIAH